MTTSSSHTPHITPHNCRRHGYGFGSGTGRKSPLSLLRHRSAPEQQARSPPRQDELHPSDVSSHSHPDATSH